jgi:hypothetical protein
MRDFWSPLLPRSILPEGSIGALEVRVTSTLGPWEL